MSLMNRFSSLSLMVLVVPMLISLVPAGAEARPGHHGKLKEMKAELNLTPEQETKMKEINKGRREQMEPKRKALRDAREALEKSLKSADSTDVVKQKFAELQKVQAEVAVARFENVLAARDVLTPEQRTKFKGMHLGGRHSHEEEEN